MSENYKIITLGREDFVFPYGMAGLEFKVIKRQDEAIRCIYEQDLKATIFILDEDIISDIEKIEELESSGVNILILKGWGKSDMAKDKIRNASIKAIGIDMSKQETMLAEEGATG